MSFQTKLAILPSALLVLGAMSIGCGDDDDNKGNLDGGTLLDASMNGGGDGGTTPTGTVDYEGTLVGILAMNTSAPIAASHQVEVLNNDTGAPLNPPITTVSAPVTGKISLKLPAGKNMLLIKGVGTDTYDTVIVNADTKTNDPLIRISNSGTLALAEGSGGFVSKPDRTPVTGSVYHAPGGVRMGTVGCAKIFLDGKTVNDTESDQRYNAASGLPGKFECTAADVMCTPVQQTGSGGRFYIANMTPGRHTIKASIDNGATAIAEASFFIPFTRSQATSTTKSVLVQIGLDVDRPANPTPAGCTAP